MRQRLAVHLVLLTLAVLGCVTAYNVLNRHIEQELERVERDAQKELEAQKAAERAKFPTKQAEKEALSPEGFLAALSAAMGADLEKSREAGERAKTAWRDRHRIEIAVRDILYWTMVAPVLALVRALVRALPPVARFLSFPLKIALGLAFGIPLGAWIAKRLKLL